MTHRPRKAFTLIELMIVISIIGILAGTILVHASSSSTERLITAARIVAADLRLARSLAVATNREWTVRFDLPNSSYELFETATENPPPEEYLKALGSDQYVIDLNNAIPTSLNNIKVKIENLQLVPSEASTNEIIFSELGGTGPTRTEDTILNLTIDGTYRIPTTVSWITGQVWVGDLETIQAGTE